MTQRQQFFRGAFEKIVGPFDIISTVDHPYVSTPLRLLDTHLSLFERFQKGERVLPIIWDMNLPNADMPWQETCFDIGPIALPKAWTQLFQPHQPSSLQAPTSLDRAAISNACEQAWKVLRPHETETRVTFARRLYDLIAIYHDTILDHQDGNGTQFCIDLLTKLYRLIGEEEVADWFLHYAQSYRTSKLLQVWIPWLVEQTQGGPSALPSETPITSYKALFWSLACAGISHFGNDHGFFEHVNGQTYQLTRPNEDSRSWLTFDRDERFIYSDANGRLKLKRANPRKPSRIATIPALFCTVGSELGGCFRDARQRQEVLTVHMWGS